MTRGFHAPHALVVKTAIGRAPVAHGLSNDDTQITR